MGAAAGFLLQEVGLLGFFGRTNSRCSLQPIAARVATRKTAAHDPTTLFGQALRVVEIRRVGVADAYAFRAEQR
jgi:hypothetical protein